MSKNTTYKKTEVSEIPKNWKITTLGGTATLNYGKGLPEEKRVDGCVPVYGSSGVTGYHNETLVAEPGYVIGRKGSIGTVYHSQEPFFPIDTVYYSTKSDIKCDFSFFYYLLKYLKLDKLNSDSAVPGLNRETAYAQKVYLPESTLEQQQIASILSSFDDKIELNRRMNKTLEEIGKALFKRWFVDFEFPNEQGKPYKSNGGKMVDSELGEIPKGWEVKDLDSISEIKNGFAFKSEDYTGEGVFLLRTRNFSQSGYVVKDEVVFLPTNFYEAYKNFQLKKFDVLLIMVGASVGSMGFVTSHVLPALQNQNMWNFRAREGQNQIFIKFLVERIVKENIGSASGSARDFFRKDFFRTIKFARPSNTILKKFNEVVSPIFEMLDKNLRGIEDLSQTRDSLLPRLMSGKLRVN